LDLETAERMKLSPFRARLGSDEGQALLETVMTTAFLVAIAIVLNQLLGPVILDAFEKITEKLSSIGP
jgi:hypothetical protein